MRQLSMKEVVLLLGYELWMHQKDTLGVNHLYKTTPLSGSGGINYFDSLEDLEKWTERVMADRKLFHDGTTLAESMLRRRGQMKED